jgi:hypothetical protein
MTKATTQPRIQNDSRRKRNNLRVLLYVIIIFYTQHTHTHTHTNTYMRVWVLQILFISRRGVSQPSLMPMLVVEMLLLLMLLILLILMMMGDEAKSVIDEPLVGTETAQACTTVLSGKSNHSTQYHHPQDRRMQCQPAAATREAASLLKQNGSG